jgi:hypothetical protein
MYIKPIASLCIILFLFALSAPWSNDVTNIKPSSGAISLVKHGNAPIKSDNASPFEEKEEDKSLDSDHLQMLEAMYHFELEPVNYQTATTGQCQTKTLNGSLPLYLSIRVLLI